MIICYDNATPGYPRGVWATFSITYTEDNLAFAYLILNRSPSACVRIFTWE